MSHVHLKIKYTVVVRYTVPHMSISQVCQSHCSNIYSLPSLYWLFYQLLRKVLKIPDYNYDLSTTSFSSIKHIWSHFMKVYAFRTVISCRWTNLSIMNYCFLSIVKLLVIKFILIHWSKECQLITTPRDTPKKNAFICAPKDTNSYVHSGLCS